MPLMGTKKFTLTPQARSQIINHIRTNRNPIYFYFLLTKFLNFIQQASQSAKSGLFKHNNKCLSIEFYLAQFSMHFIFNPTCTSAKETPY